jgi:hypothetical protein
MKTISSISLMKFDYTTAHTQKKMGEKYRIWLKRNKNTRWHISFEGGKQFFWIAYYCIKIERCGLSWCACGDLFRSRYYTHGTVERIISSFFQMRFSFSFGFYLSIESRRKKKEEVLWRDPCASYRQGRRRKKQNAVVWNSPIISSFFYFKSQLDFFILFFFNIARKRCQFWTTFSMKKKKMLVWRHFSLGTDQQFLIHPSGHQEKLFGCLLSKKKKKSWTSLIAFHF